MSIFLYMVIYLYIKAMALYVRFLGTFLRLAAVSTNSVAFEPSEANESRRSRFNKTLLL